MLAIRCCAPSSGTIHRFHGSDHRPWGYDNHTEDVIRSYLVTRYKMAPSLVAAGQATAETGFPFVARADLFWPEFKGLASDNTQYIFINDTLVAPIWDSSTNGTTRDVWVPPGTWHDAWDGSVVTGPKSLTTRAMPYEQQPMWHRDGSLIVMTDKPGLRIETQDWSELTLDAFPTAGASDTRRSVFALKTAVKTDVAMQNDGDGKASFSISTAADGSARSWMLRLHLKPGQRVVSATVDDVALALSAVAHIAPVKSVDTPFFPFGGVGTAPAANAGHIAEITLASGAHARSVEVVIA